MAKHNRWDKHVAKKIEHMLLAAADKHCSPAGTPGKRGAWAEIQALLAALDLAGTETLANAATKLLLSVARPGGGSDFAASALLVADLAACGARLNERDASGGTALHYQAAAGATPVVDVLISKGADPSARDAAGATAGELAAEAGHAALATSLEAARLSKEEASAIHGDALWVIECDARKDGGAEAVGMLMAFELSGDQARRLRSASLEPGFHKVAEPSDHLAPFGNNEMCRHAFKAWAGLAKGASSHKPSIHSGDPSSDGFGRLAAQKLVVHIFKSANLPTLEDFEALGRHIASKSGATSWAVEPFPAGQGRPLDGLFECALRGAAQSGDASVAAKAREVAMAARAKLDRSLLAIGSQASGAAMAPRRAVAL